MTLSTILHAYSFDTRTPEGLAAWQAFKAERKASGAPLFGPVYHGVREDLAHDGATIELDPGAGNINLFQDQWNATAAGGLGFRAFDWILHAERSHRSQIVGAPAGIKRGYWLEQTEEMRRLRADTLTCGYCGHKHPIADAPAFCPACIGSEYLTPADFPLTRLAPVADGRGKAARLQRSIAGDQMRMREQVQSELRTAERHRAEHQASWQAALLEGAAINRKRRRAVLFARDLQKRLNTEYALVDRANMKRSEAEEAARDWSRKEEAQRQRANVAEAALTKLRADLADPHQPERESDLLLLKRQRDEARAEAERERNAAAAVNERNTRLQSVMADLGERFEVMAGRVARAEAALRVQGAVA